MESTVRQSERERLLRVLSAATFFVFFQAYMVAPLIPKLSAVFQVSGQRIGLIVPAYLVPYGVSTLFYGLLSDRIGRRKILLASLLAFVALTALTATTQSATQITLWRFATGLGASGVVPLALALMGSLFPYEQRGRPLGWLFGAMAGGAAFGSTFGVLAEPFVGWRMLFLAVAAAGAIIFCFVFQYRHLLGEPAAVEGQALPSVKQSFQGYRSLLTPGRGLRTYGYVFWNGIFHSGIYTWLGLYFAQRYHSNEVGIGLALLGYGVPGFVLGPLIGRAADHLGRRWLVPAGIVIAAISGAMLIPQMPVIVAAVAVMLLSLGYDMTQPLLAGIVTSLGGQRAGQAMGLNVFTLFVGFGVGSYLFGEALRFGFDTALMSFSAVQLTAAIIAIPAFRDERH